MTGTYDPWVNVKTRHGFAADEIISALQKEIRRGNTENAVLLAYEMITTSPEMEAKLWQRLQVISVEDIGWGEIQAPILIHSLCQMRLAFDYGMGDRNLFSIHAVRYLCACQKDRSSDEMLNWVIRQVEDGQLLPTIPEYALDMHTARGQQMGRGLRHFLEEGAKIAPELSGRDQSYREKLLKLLDKND